MGFWDNDDRDPKRTLCIRDKQILWERAKHKCENPACRKTISFVEMQPGHKKPWSKGGRTTLANCVCLCYKCNKLQGDDSWEVFCKKQGVSTPEMKAKEAKGQTKQKLTDLTLPQLKLLATKHKVKVPGKIEETMFSSRRLAPTKADFVKKLSGVVTDADLRSLPKPEPKPVKKTRKKSDSWW
ncbi:MAG: HNH endonuclease signature motif containing protein [Dehalococcoidales bacterium]|nr:HNH endonuclease signature motif containing protein [Dehalococcoidales bacterium]